MWMLEGAGGLGRGGQGAEVVLQLQAKLGGPQPRDLAEGSSLRGPLSRLQTSGRLQGRHLLSIKVKPENKTQRAAILRAPPVNQTG